MVTSRIIFPLGFPIDRPHNISVFLRLKQLEALTFALEILKSLLLLGYHFEVSDSKVDAFKETHCKVNSFFLPDSQDLIVRLIVLKQMIVRVIVSGAKSLESDWFRGVRLIVNCTITTFCTLWRGIILALFLISFSPTPCEGIHRLLHYNKRDFTL